jgi:hypothetical protein
MTLQQQPACAWRWQPRCSQPTWQHPAARQQRQQSWVPCRAWMQLVWLIMWVRRWQSLCRQHRASQRPTGLQAVMMMRKMQQQVRIQG